MSEDGIPVLKYIKKKGKTNTLLLFEPAPNTPGQRGGDNMTLQISDEISEKTAKCLINEMVRTGIIGTKKFPAGNTRYFVNSTMPKEFMAQPQIKIIIENFLNKETFNVQNSASIKNSSEQGLSLKLNDINMVSLGREQDKNNVRNVKDYLREFLSNNKQFTVVHDTIDENSRKKDITVLLIPVGHDWDCYSISIDANIHDDKCKDLVEYLSSKKMTDTDDIRFKQTVPEYFNK